MSEKQVAKIAKLVKHIESGDVCHKGITARKCHCERTPGQSITEGLRHFMVDGYSGQFDPKLTSAITSTIKEEYLDDTTLTEEDVNEVLCVLNYLAGKEGGLVGEAK